MCLANHGARACSAVKQARKNQSIDVPHRGKLPHPNPPGLRPVGPTPERAPHLAAPVDSQALYGMAVTHTLSDAADAAVAVERVEWALAALDPTCSPRGPPLAAGASDHWGYAALVRLARIAELPVLGEAAHGECSLAPRRALARLVSARPSLHMLPLSFFILSMRLSTCDGLCAEALHPSRTPSV